jgi:serine protease AprX
MADRMYLERWVVEQLMFGSGRVRRFTQDTPVLPDVWIEYAIDPTKRQEEVARRRDIDELELLLTPFRDTPTGRVAAEVRRRVTAEREDPESKRYHDNPRQPRVVYHQSAVMATLYFEDLVRAVIPMTDWWRRLRKRFDVSHLQNPDVERGLAKAVMDPEHPPVGLDGKTRLPPDVLWLLRVVGAIALVHTGTPLPEVFTDREKGPGKATADDWEPLVKAVAALMADVDPADPEARIHSVALNRIARTTVSGSRLAVKADAATRLFNISCKDIRWAVIDSGIDATHPAFQKKRADDDKVAGRGYWTDHDSRVRQTYDFSQIHQLLDADNRKLTDHLTTLAGGDQDKVTKYLADVEEIRKWLAAGRSIDWGVLAPLLRVPHDASYADHIPANDHGTHVAGILGGNWTHDENEKELPAEEQLTGICPDIELYDLRILDEEGNGDEFTVMAALQFVRWLNATNDFMAVHGVNMSLSIPHDVANYACGRTPICDEAERVVSSGIVVVVAAGNQGYRPPNDSNMGGYNVISITDPGNADMVITVGATHRARPHTYGVSYFSSRGPTGDGRSKPDLVAPGEKITAPLPRGMYGLKDGTSMAAPHVSGAAAMLMARHNELVGRPQRIKQILCDTATDLGRERYFQGAGMLDILRAMQSV